jgi:hypothetical protein
MSFKIKFNNFLYVPSIKAIIHIFLLLIIANLVISTYTLNDIRETQKSVSTILNLNKNKTNSLNFDNGYFSSNLYFEQYIKSLGYKLANEKVYELPIVEKENNKQIDKNYIESKNNSLGNFESWMMCLKLTNNISEANLLDIYPTDKPFNLNLIDKNNELKCKN